MAEIPLSGATLGDMKSRVADELARTDLTTQIANAIQDAIVYYQSERTLFNESRDMTFSTVISQEFYTSADLAQIPTLMSIDYLILYLGNTVPWIVKRMAPIELEVFNQNGLIKGQPTRYSYYNKQLRLGPVPDAVYSMRLAGQVQQAAPATDTEANNPWMIDAEKLIRCRAKYELHTHYTRNEKQAALMKAAELDALEEVKGRTNRLTGTGMIAPMEW